MKRRLTAAGLLLAVMLLLSTSSRASAPAGVYFTAANDNLLELNAETMPFYSNNVLYVSSRVFDGTGLGVSYTRSTSLGVAMLYNTSTDLRFDLAGQIAYDKEGNLYSGYAIEQGGVVFFPLALVCRYFGLTWSVSETDVAPLIRVKNSNVILGDATFIDAAASLLQERYGEYERSLSGTASPVTPPPEQPTEEPPPAAAEGQMVYLLLSAQSSEDILNLLDVLDGTQATFLLTADQMLDGDLLRALTAQGHAVALRILAEDPEDAAAELALGRERLWQAACLWLDLAWYGGSGDIGPLLDSQGYVRVTAPVGPPSDAQSYTNRIASLMQAIRPYREDLGVYLGDAGECRGLLPGLLRDLEESGYRTGAWRLTA